MSCASKAKAHYWPSLTLLLTSSHQNGRRISGSQWNLVIILLVDLMEILIKRWQSWWIGYDRNIIWRQLPKDPFKLSLIPRDESKPQFCIRRVAKAPEAGGSISCVVSVWSPTLSCCRGGFQGESVAIVVVAEPCKTSDALLVEGIKL